MDLKLDFALADKPDAHRLRRVHSGNRNGTGE